MSDDVKSLHHMITVWNAHAAPTVIPLQLQRTLADYLVSFLKSADGERYLRTLGYVRAESAPSQR